MIIDEIAFTLLRETIFQNARQLSSSQQLSQTVIYDIPRVSYHRTASSVLKGVTLT